jgi:hypothetical protein
LWNNKKCFDTVDAWYKHEENLSGVFPIKNGVKLGNALLPLLFNFALENAIRRVQVNQDGLKLYGTH